jgi:regulatory protein
MLAARRLTESQLWQKLARRGYDEADVRAAVASCVADGFIDDALFARLYIDGRPKAVGNARLVAELVRKGIERRAAQHAVTEAARQEPERLDDAIEKLFRTRPSLSYPSAARSLERLGFPTHAIYRELRNRAAAEMASGAIDAG